MITPAPHIPEVEGVNNPFGKTVNGCRDSRHYTNIIAEGVCDSCGRAWRDEKEDGESVRIESAKQAERNRLLDTDPDDYRDNEEDR